MRGFAQIYTQIEWNVKICIQKSCLPTPTLKGMGVKLQKYLLLEI